MAHSIGFGQWLKSRRKALDLTQKMFAERVHCSPETIYKIESEQRRPSTQLANLIANELNISPAELDDFVTFARSKEKISTGASTLPTNTMAGHLYSAQ